MTAIMIHMCVMMSLMQCECDENMMMLCLHHLHAMQTIMMWCSSNANTIMSCHLIPMWHEWNANTGDIMVMWFA